MLNKDCSKTTPASNRSSFFTATTAASTLCAGGHHSIRVNYHIKSKGSQRLYATGYHSDEEAAQELQLYRVVIELGFQRSWINPYQRHDDGNGILFIKTAQLKKFKGAFVSRWNRSSDRSTCLSPLHPALAAILLEEGSGACIIDTDRPLLGEASSPPMLETGVDAGELGEAQHPPPTSAPSSPAAAAATTTQSTATQHQEKSTKKDEDIDPSVQLRMGQQPTIAEAKKGTLMREQQTRML